jgi:choline dehydrogenase-like flavoprotein
MILAQPTLAELRAVPADVVVVGSGPVGTATALALARRGRRVLVLESGGPGPDPAAAALSEAENLRPDNHYVPHTAVARRLGGTSNLWGGRCVPFDAIDFEARPWLGLPAWPIGPEALAPHLAEAVALLGAGGPVFRAELPGFRADGAFGVDRLERWSNVPRMQRLHRRALTEAPGLAVALRTTVLGFRCEDGRVGALEVHVEGEGRGLLPVARLVLAAGGNESTRLLLAAQRRQPGLFGGADGPLGRFYMGHLGGQIADIVFEDARLHDALDFHVDAHGSYVRRRILPAAATQAEARLANTAFWPVVPRIAGPEHRSGPLSAVFLALSFPGLGGRFIAEPLRLKHVGLPPYRRGAHLRNLLADLPRTLGFVPAFLWRTQVARRRLPGFFLGNPARRYGLEFHAEQLPDPASRLRLAEATDRLGLPRLAIELRFSDADAGAVLRAHDALEAWLLRNRLARLEYHGPPESRHAAVLAAACDGAHQIGTIRMGTDRRRAVVDADCRSFDLANLFVASTAVLPSSGQANPTLTAVQLGLRLAERLAAEAAAPSVAGEAGKAACGG